MELYEEVESKKKSKLPMIMGICLAVLIVIIIAIIGLIIYLEGSVMKISLDGQKNNDIKKLEMPEDDIKSGMDEVQELINKYKKIADDYEEKARILLRENTDLKSRIKELENGN